MFPAPMGRGIPGGARRILLIATSLLLPMLLASYLYSGVPMALGVFGGGVLALINFWLLARIVVKTTGGEMQGSALFGRLFVKYLILAASLGVVILLLRLDSLGLILGVGVIFPAILLGSMFDLFRADDDSSEVAH